MGDGPGRAVGARRPATDLSDAGLAPANPQSPLTSVGVRGRISSATAPTFGS